MCQENTKKLIYIPFSIEEYNKACEDIKKQHQSLLNRIDNDFKESRKILQKEIGLPIASDENNNLKMIG